MWILHLLPDNFLYNAVLSIIFGGVFLYIVSLVLNLLLKAYPYKNTLRTSSILIILIGIYFYGGYSTEMIWREKVKEIEAKLAIAEEKSAKVNNQIQVKIVKQTKIIRERGQNVTRYIDREVTKYDNTCPIPAPVVKAHNAAATNSVVKE